MSEELLIRHCSPTLAGLKTANMFSAGYDSEEELIDFLRSTNRRLSSKGIRVMPLKWGDGQALIYIFRPSHLKKDLEDKEAVKLLSGAGYFNELEDNREAISHCRGAHNLSKKIEKVERRSAPKANKHGDGFICESDCAVSCAGMGKCLARLAGKLKADPDFPHEIGLFLGYPPEDVRGFIEQGSRGCKAVGQWKVYGDEEAAKKKFASFNKCSEIYNRLYREGRPVEKLAVSAAQ